MNIRVLYAPFIMALLHLCFVSPVQADDEDDEGPPSYHRFIGLGGGVMSPMIDHQTNFANSGMPGFPDDKYVTNDWKQSPFISLTSGYRWQYGTDWLTAMSLALQYTYAQPELRGDIYMNALDDSKNFRYQYDLKQQLLQLHLKLNLFKWYDIMPYFTVGAGIASNHVDNYSESPIPGATAFGKRYQFKPASTTQFAKSIGIGIDYWIEENTAITLGYRYTTIGKVQTGYGEGVLANNRLMNELSMKSVELQALYFF